MSHKHHAWTNPEKDFIVDNADRLKDKEIAAILSRNAPDLVTVYAVQHVRQILGLRKRRGSHAAWELSFPPNVPKLQKIRHPEKWHLPPVSKEQIASCVQAYYKHFSGLYRLPVKRNQYINELLLAGVSVRQIVEQTGISFRTVYRCRRKLEI